MKNLNRYFSSLCLSLIVVLISSCFPEDPEGKTDTGECYVPNDIQQIFTGGDSTQLESLVWAPNDSVVGHLVIYEPLPDGDINLQQGASNKQFQQNNPPSSAEREALFTSSDTFTLAEIPYTGPMDLYAYSVQSDGRIGSTPVMASVGDGTCSIVITDDVMMLTGAICDASTTIRNNATLAPRKSVSVPWSASPDSLYHCTITRNGFTSQFVLQLRADTAGNLHWGPVSDCGPVNMPVRSGDRYIKVDPTSGCQFSIEKTCTGFRITNTASSGNISVLVKRN